MEIPASWELGLRYGHLALLGALAKPLAEAGHWVTLAAKDLVTAAAVTDEVFARKVQAPLYLRSTPRKATHTYGQVIHDGGFGDPVALEALVKGWLTLFEFTQPELVIVEHAPASLLAAYVAGIPSVRTGIPFTVPVATRPMPRLLPDAADPALGEIEPIGRPTPR